MKDYLVHGAQIIQSVSVYIILVAAEIKDLRVWIFDVKFIYLQSDKLLLRKMLVTNPAPELKLAAKELLELLKSIGGLADSGDE